ncbi:MAG: VOC family protein [Chloroflexi bacterium]|nr:VOC family protein [Chloroflexota bacterium]
MPAVTNLGHPALFCEDLERMRDFYSGFMGMTITDEDLDRGICSLSELLAFSKSFETTMVMPRGAAK